MSGAPAPVLEAIAPVLPKAMKASSVVARSKVPATSSKEIIKKVVKDAGPSLRVRIYELKHYA